jgi:hypothetical protein
VRAFPSAAALKPAGRQLGELIAVAGPRCLQSVAITHPSCTIYHDGHFDREDALTIIPKILHEHLNNSYPAHVCLIGTVLPNGYAQITPRGSTMVFDDEHFALWERGRGSTNANLVDGSKLTVFFRKPPLRESGLLPRGGIARFYGTATIHKSGPIYEEIWQRLIEPEKKSDPEKKGFGVLISVERAEDLSGAPLAI